MKKLNKTGPTDSFINLGSLTRLLRTYGGQSSNDVSQALG